LLIVHAEGAAQPHWGLVSLQGDDGHVPPVVLAVVVAVVVPVPPPPAPTYEEPVAQAVASAVSAASAIASGHLTRRKRTPTACGVNDS
jgi:hypothetical protein